MKGGNSKSAVYNWNGPNGPPYRRPGESYHVICGKGDVTDSRQGDIFTFISLATENLKKQDKFQPRDKSYLYNITLKQNR